MQPENPLVQKPETLKLNEFLKETVFFCIFCSNFVLFVFKFRATGILCFRNWLKYATGNTKSDRMLNFSLITVEFLQTEKAWEDAVQGHKSNGRWKVVGHRYFCDSREVFKLEMLKIICDDLVMEGRAEILKVWLYFRVWYAVGAKIVRWRYRQVPFMLKLHWSLHVLYTGMPLSHRFLIHKVIHLRLSLYHFSN